MTTTLYYALWYYCDIYGSRLAYAISKNRQNLIPLHEKNVKTVSWQGNSEIVSEIKIAPIECYTYNIKTKEIEPYQELHMTYSHQFYAFDTMLCGDNDYGCSVYKDVEINIVDSDGNAMGSNDYDLGKDEILIYLSYSVHKIWKECSNKYKYYTKFSNGTSDFVMDPYLPTFFYTQWPSHSCVDTDVYFKDGIMNV